MTGRGSHTFAGRRARALIAVIAVAAASCSIRQAAPATDSYVVILSFDGFSADYLQRGLTPNLQRLADSGASATLLPVFPTKTFPNHYSIATGLYPGSHGIIANRFYDPLLRDNFVSTDSTKAGDAKWFGGEPFWVTAERQGIVAATCFWPGSEAAIGGVRPTHYRVFKPGTPVQRQIDQVAQWLRMPAARRPRLIALYVGLVDSIGHRFGPSSARLDSALVAADHVVGQLVREVARTPVRDRLNFVVVSDHGMAPFSEWVRLDAHAPIERSMLVEVGPVVSLHLQRDSSRIAATRRALAGLKGARAYTRAEAPARYRLGTSPRWGDILVVADSGYSVGLTDWWSGVDLATHGYDPALPAMHGIFIAHGPDIRAGRLEPFENIHVYRVITDLLRLQPASSIDGDARVAARVVRRRSN